MNRVTCVTEHATYFQPFDSSLRNDFKDIYAHYMIESGSTNPIYFVQRIGPFGLLPVLANFGYRVVNKWLAE